MSNSGLQTLLMYTLWNEMRSEEEFTSDEEDKLSLSDDDESAQDLMMFTVMNEALCDDKFTSDEEDSLFSSDSDDSAYLTNAALIAAIAQQRCMRPRHGRKNRDYVDNYFLNQSDSDFRIITRVDRDTFDHILSLIENDGVFQNDHKSPQHPIHWQLACALDTLGNDGRGVCHAHSKSIWGIGKGTIHLYTRRVVRALCNLKSQYIRWPSVVEREQIALRMAKKGFKGAVGVVDCTTISLHKKSSINGNVFLDKRKTYSVNAQVVFDDMSRIIFFKTSHPGSSGDSQVFNSTSLAMTPERPFSANEYLLADCSYAPIPTVVPAYKKNQRDCRSDGDEPNKIERFNNYLAKARAINERTIGILKNRWSSLKQVQIDLHKRKDMRSFVEQAVACVVLHNLCLTSDPWDVEFLDTADSASVDNDSERAMQESLLTPSERAMQESASTSGRKKRQCALTPGQRKRWAVRNACLAFHDRQAS